MGSSRVAAVLLAVTGMCGVVASGAQASPVRHFVAGDQSGSDQQDSDEFSFDPPGPVTGEAVDTTGIPASLFHGVGDALISSEVGGSVLTTFGTDEDGGGLSGWCGARVRSARLRDTTGAYDHPRDGGQSCSSPPAAVRLVLW